MKILAIGNSFSCDATRYLQEIAESAGKELYVRNLYIGGCSLETHAKNIKSGDEAYEYQENCNKLRMISVNEAIKAEEWDWVTVQQVSGYSGIYKSYEPYLTEIVEFIKENAPQAKIAFHRTWAYEITSEHPDFLCYDRDQKKMYDSIIEATSKAAESHGLPIISSGDAIQRARALKPFDYTNGGLSLNRDGFHLSFDYGRYLAGLVWFKFFTGRDVKSVNFRPDGTDEAVIKQLMDIA